MKSRIEKIINPIVIFIIIGLDSLFFYNVLGFKYWWDEWRNQIVAVVFSNILLFPFFIVSTKKGYNVTFKLFFTRYKVSVLLMLGSVLIALLSGKPNERMNGYVVVNENKSPIELDMLGMILSIAFCTSILVRYNIKYNAKVLVSLFFDFIFFAFIINIFANDKNIIDIPILNLSPRTLIIFALIFSWVGVRAFAGILWLVILLFALLHIGFVDSTMGIWGAFFILLGSVSLMIQGVLLNENQNINFLSVGDDFRKKITVIKSDIQEGTEAVVEFGSKAKKVAMAATGISSMQSEKSKKSLENKE